MCLLLTSVPAQATDNKIYTDLENKVYQIPLFGKKDGYKSWCSQSFATIWPLAKEGNMEARAMLLRDYSLHRRHLPGHYDRVSTKRDLFILLIYASGYKSLKQQSLTEYIPEMFQDDDAYIDVLNCIKTSSSKQCLNIALQQNLVPTFDDFATEIDYHIAKGKVSQCDGGIAFMHQTVKSKGTSP